MAGSADAIPGSAPMTWGHGAAGKHRGPSSRTDIDGQCWLGSLFFRGRKKGGTTTPPYGCFVLCAGMRKKVLTSE